MHLTITDYQLTAETVFRLVDDYYCVPFVIKDKEKYIF